MRSRVLVPIAAILLIAAPRLTNAELATFEVDSTLSIIRLIDTAFLDAETIVQLPAQAGTGDVVNYGGTLTGDLVGGTLTFSSGSAVRAFEHPDVEDFIPEEEGPGGPDVADDQDINYAYELEDFPGGLYVQLFDMSLDMISGEITNGQPANGFVSTLDEGGYAIVLEDPDIIQDTAWFNRPFNVIEEDDPASVNRSMDNATISLSGETQTVTIPIDLEFFFDIDLCCGNVGPTQFNLIGQIVASRTVDGIPGDYNGNGEIDAGDLDVHAQYIQDGDLTGDVDSNNLVNTADRAAWAEIYQNSWLGDSDFNGVFDEQDFVAAFIGGKYLTEETATYAEGDWDGNMVFDEGDFVAAFIEGGYLMGPRASVSAVPEPGGLALLLCGCLGVLRIRRRAIAS